MLSPTADQGTPTPTKSEERGKQNAATEENNTSKLLSLLKEMKEEMRGMDAQMREELRWRDMYLEDQIKKRENTLAAALQQRDEEWKEELANKDILLRVELREGERLY